MERAQLRRRKEAGKTPGALEQNLRRQMAWAAGTEAFAHRDPLYHVTESFQQTFDAMGRRHAAQLAARKGKPANRRRAKRHCGRRCLIRLPPGPSMSGILRKTRI